MERRTSYLRGAAAAAAAAATVATSSDATAAAASSAKTAAALPTAQARAAARGKPLMFLHISLADWLLGLLGAAAYILAMQATRLPLAPLALPFELRAGAPPQQLWPPAAPEGRSPPPARALLEGRAALFALGASSTRAPASSAPSAAFAPLTPLPLPRPFLPLPRALRANASVSLELALLRGAPAAPAGLELCVAVEDARGADITAALEPFAAAGACAAPRGRRLALKAPSSYATFAMPPGARLFVTLGAAAEAAAADAPLGGELRLSVSAGASAEGSVALVMI